MRLLKLVPDNTNIDFLRWRNVAFAISSLLITASIALLATKGLNFGVDFAGGQMIRATFQQPPQLDELRERIGALGYGDASVQESRASAIEVGGAQGHEVLIRMPLPEEEDEAAANRAATEVRNAITENFPGARIDAVETVSGKVSEEMDRAGALARDFGPPMDAVAWDDRHAALRQARHDVLDHLVLVAVIRGAPGRRRGLPLAEALGRLGGHLRQCHMGRRWRARRAGGRFHGRAGHGDAAAGE